MADDNTNDAQAHGQPSQPNPASPRAMTWPSGPVEVARGPAALLLAA